MKTPKRVNYMIAALLILGSCQEAVKEESDGNVQFSMQTVSRESMDKKLDSTPKAVIVTITRPDNEVVISKLQLNLYGLGESYISESLTLGEGDYFLTEFYVLGDSQKVIYAAPVAESEMAQYVSQPLPIAIHVTSSHTTMITPQVIPVLDNDNPTKFGYLQFGFEVVYPDGTQLKEYEVFDFDLYSNEYVPHEKYLFFYKNEKLIKRESNYYLKDYDVYYKDTYDTLEYNNNGKLSKVTSVVNKNRETLWEYVLTYPEQNKISWDWWSVLGGYRDLYINYTYTQYVDTFWVEITEFPGQPSSSKYLITGRFNNEQNMVSKNFSDNDGVYQSLLKNTTYDHHPNPLKNIHYFFSSESPVFISNNNPTLLRYENVPYTSYYQENYTYEYNAQGYPVKCNLTINSNGVVSKKMMLYRYQ